jgi:hypothetical protein
MLARCREAHEALGLHAVLIDPLLDPALDRGQVVTNRKALVLSWANHPDDIGARAMALLSARLARAYYGKARADGTTQAARVINAKSRELLDATLRDWNGLVEYLGEKLSSSNAQPTVVP